MNLFKWKKIGLRSSLNRFPHFLFKFRTPFLSFSPFWISFATFLRHVTFFLLSKDWENVGVTQIDRWHPFYSSQWSHNHECKPSVARAFFRNRQTTRFVFKANHLASDWQHLKSPRSFHPKIIKPSQPVTTGCRSPGRKAQRWEKGTRRWGERQSGPLRLFRRESEWTRKSLAPSVSLNGSF